MYWSRKKFMRECIESRAEEVRRLEHDAENPQPMIPAWVVVDMLRDLRDLVEKTMATPWIVFVWHQWQWKRMNRLTNKV